MNTIKNKILVIAVLTLSLTMWAAPQPPQPTPPPGEAIIPGIIAAVLGAIGYGMYKLFILSKRK